MIPIEEQNCSQCSHAANEKFPSAEVMYGAPGNGDSHDTTGGHTHAKVKGFAAIDTGELEKV